MVAVPQRLMRGPTHFEQGIDHSSHATVTGLFGSRFPKVKLLSCFVCREWPFTKPRNVITFEGHRDAILGYGLIASRLVPPSMRLERNSHTACVRRIGKDRLQVRLFLWSDAPLPELHPLAPICPSRWPLYCSAELRDGVRVEAIELRSAE
jgi:hypothetical protein